MSALTQRLFLVVIACLFLSTAASAQRRSVVPLIARPTFGPQLGDATHNLDFFIGGQLGYQVAPRFDLYPSFVFYFPNVGSAWSLNANVRYWPKLAMPNPGLYAGGGLGFTHVSAGGFSDTKVSLNLLGGWEFHTPTLRPFVELRAILASNVDRVEFAGGLNFTL